MEVAALFNLNCFIFVSIIGDNLKPPTSNSENIANTKFNQLDN